MTKKISTIAILLIFVFGYNLVGKEDDEILATVNGDPITLYAVHTETAKEEAQLGLMFSGTRLKEEIKKVRKRAIDDIIARKLVSARFKERGYKVPKQLIEEMLNSITADLAGGDRKMLEKKARQSGITMEKLREQAHMRAATMMLINARCYANIYITPKQIYEYYEKHKKDFALARKIRLQILYLKSKGETGAGNIAQFAIRLQPKIVKADEKAFGEFVKTYSLGPNKDLGGDVGWMDINKLRPEFSLALKNKGKGSVVGPVKTAEGFYFIRIKELEDAKEKSFESVREAIKKKLEDEEKAKNYKAYIKKIRSFAVIHYYL